MTDKNTASVTATRKKKAPWGFLWRTDNVEVSYALWDSKIRNLKELGDYSADIMRSVNLEAKSLNVIAFQSDVDIKAKFSGRTFDIPALLRSIAHVTNGKIDPRWYIEEEILRFLRIDCTTFDEYRKESKLIDYSKLEKLDGNRYTDKIRLPNLLTTLLSTENHAHNWDEAKVYLGRDFYGDVIAFPMDKVRDIHYQRDKLRHKILNGIVKSFTEDYNHTVDEIQNFLYRLSDVNVLNGLDSLFIPYSLKEFCIVDEVVNVFKDRMNNKKLAFVIKDKIANLTLGDFMHYKEMRKHTTLNEEALKALITVGNESAIKAEDQMDTIKDKIRGQFTANLKKKHGRSVAFLKDTQLGVLNSYFCGLDEVPTVAIPMSLDPFAEISVDSNDYKELYAELDIQRRFNLTKQLMQTILNVAFEDLFKAACERSRSKPLDLMSYEDAAIINASAFFSDRSVQYKDRNGSMTLYKKEEELSKFPISTVIEGHVDTLLKFLNKK